MSLVKTKNAKALIIGIALIAGCLMGAAFARPASAFPVTCADGTTVEVSNPDGAVRACQSHGGSVGGAAGSPDSKFEGECKNGDLSTDCGIVEYINLAINILSGLVGVVIVIMITVGGIQYSASKDNPQATAAAKGRIINAMTALVIYLFMVALLQYIVPGGIL